MSDFQKLETVTPNILYSLKNRGIIETNKNSTEVVAQQNYSGEGLFSGLGHAISNFVTGLILLAALTVYLLWTRK